MHHCAITFKLLVQQITNCLLVSALGFFLVFFVFYITAEIICVWKKSQYFYLQTGFLFW